MYKWTELKNFNYTHFELQSVSHDSAYALNWSSPFFHRIVCDVVI
jgi:hypothetical protein